MTNMEHPLRFGMLHLFENPLVKTEHQIVKEQLDLMQAAEDLGFDSIWPAEHHFTEYGYCASTALMLAPIARVTKRIRLGTGVAILPFHNPLRVAEEFALLDLMSDGRLDFGVGRGYQPIEYAGFQIDQSKSRGLFKESLDIVLQAWTTGKVTYHGEHFHYDEQPVRPQPLQKPHPPVWVAGISNDTFAHVGKLGCNLLCTQVFGPFSTDLIDQYRGALAANGHDPEKKNIAVLCMAYVAETREQALRDFVEPVLWYYRTIAKYIAGDRVIPGYEAYNDARALAAAANWDELIASGAVICGNPDQVIQQMEAVRDRYHATDVLLWTRLGGFESKNVMKSMLLMEKYVFPHFRKRTPKVAA
jgi:luciferase family oxidoreductase group 1